MTRDLKRLVDLAYMIREIELARLTALLAERNHAEALVNRLETQAHHTRELARSDPDFLTGSGSNWDAWVDQKRRVLQGQTALAAADAEAQLLIARRAFGRAQSMAHVVAKHESQQRV